MQKYNKFVSIAGLALSAGLLATITPQTVFAHGKDKHKQNVTVTVNEKGYTPSAIKVKAGQPVHLTFVSKGGGCANGISIPALKKTLQLKKGEKKEVVFTPKKGQIIAFACSMKMFKGSVIAK